MSSTDAVRRAMCAKPREVTWPSVSSPLSQKDLCLLSHPRRNFTLVHTGDRLHTSHGRSFPRLKIHLSSSALEFTEATTRRRRKGKEAAPHDLEGLTGTVSSLRPQLMWVLWLLSVRGDSQPHLIPQAGKQMIWVSQQPWQILMVGSSSSKSRLCPSILGALPGFRSWSGKGGVSEFRRRSP
ncbi:hypothetical protein B296_00020818 [Ensete ventricosum]|uniref:Uncharacterized protein n=1 Tax=Ensete ventricosum TaxID=4639 RepID=A0A426ZHT8_ENSVE|nr:hypothetical protein B296_00020818 [Ensete ventricosum]